MRKSDREIIDFDQLIHVMEKCDVCRLALNDEEYLKDKYEAICLIMKHYKKENFEFNKEVLPITSIFKLTVYRITGKFRLLNK